MLLIALAVAGCAGYFSVWGLSQLFAGASTAVIIMATVLEIGKVITTTALHRYWSKLATSLKIYLTISVAVLMMITSAGIYGFLSNAYQKTANKLEIHEGELSVLDGKKLLFEKNIADNEKIVLTKNKRIDQLSNLRTNQENRLDSAKNVKAKDKVRADIVLATTEIQKLSTDIDGLNAKNAVLSDSVGKYNVKMLELKSGNEVAGEVGPLKYIAELTGAPMGKVVNYLILLLIFVFDPLAIALILMTNRVFELDGQPNPLEPKKEIVEDLEVTNEILPIRESSTTAIVSDLEEIKEQEKKQLTDRIAKINAELEKIEVLDEPIFEDEQSEDVEATDSLDVVVEEPTPVVEEITATEINEEVEPIVEETKLVSEKEIEVPIYKKEPVIPTGKIEVEDIKEIKENRGYSTPIPQPKGNNTIERIGQNKVIKNGDNNKLFFRRK